MNNNQDLISFYKDILYLIGSVLGIVGFIRTLKKVDHCCLNYRTDFGNEVEPYLICLKSNMYNLLVTSKERAVFVHKYPSHIPPLHGHRQTVPTGTTERSTFFPVLKEQEFIVVDNNDFKMGRLYFYYEDRYSNKFRQEFTFDQTEVGNTERIKRANRSCYRLTKRKIRFLGMWFPYA